MIDKKLRFCIGRIEVKNRWLLIVIARIEEITAFVFDRIHYILTKDK